MRQSPRVRASLPGFELGARRSPTGRAPRLKKQPPCPTCNTTILATGICADGRPQACATSVKLSRSTWEDSKLSRDPGLTLWGVGPGDPCKASTTPDFALWVAGPAGEVMPDRCGGAQFSRNGHRLSEVVTSVTADVADAPAAQGERGSGVGVDLSAEDAESIVIGATDARRVVAYLLAQFTDEYIAIMGVVDASVTDLNPADVAHELRQVGAPMDPRTIDARLEKLRQWGAVTARHDASQATRYTDLVARNWRYSATAIGRQTQRFFITTLADVQVIREIPLPSLQRVVESLRELATLLGPAGRPAGPEKDAVIASLIGTLFAAHEDLDTALVGAEDNLAGMADRFDLDDSTTSELKGMLVDYATHVAAELEDGAARAHQALLALMPQAQLLVDAVVGSSDARALIERGALTASRGGRSADWVGLATWLDPATGRAARFAMRLVRALPGMHANLRRLHTGAGIATTRARALAFARASMNPEYGSAIWAAAVGDHSWRKLAGFAEDEEATRGSTPWREGPGVDLPEMLRSSGRTGSRGRAASSRDDSAARAAVAARRQERVHAHALAMAEVLTAAPGAPLSDAAARVALAAVAAASRGTRHPATPARPVVVRTGTKDGLACTLVYVGLGAGAVSAGLVRAPLWKVILPGRVPLFHAPGSAATIPQGLTVLSDPDSAEAVIQIVRGVA